MVLGCCRAKNTQKQMMALPIIFPAKIEWSNFSAPIKLVALICCGDLM